MRPARSRRVQAQRKFAQGAYVPPNVVTVAAADNRRDATQDPRSVTVNSMTATGLLDVVALQSHSHLTTSLPVVIVERLRGNHLARDFLPPPPPPPPLLLPLPPPRSRNDTAVTRPWVLLHERVNNNVGTVKKPADPPKLQTFRKRKEYKTQHNMTLRSRHSNKLLLNKLWAATCCSPVPRLASKRKKNSSDEDEPLIFKQTRLKQAAARVIASKQTAARQSAPQENSPSSSKEISLKKKPCKKRSKKEITAHETFKKKITRETTSKKITNETSLKEIDRRNAKQSIAKKKTPMKKRIAKECSPTPPAHDIPEFVVTVIKEDLNDETVDREDLATTPQSVLVDNPPDRLAPDVLNDLVAPVIPVATDDPVIRPVPVSNSLPGLVNMPILQDLDGILPNFDEVLEDRNIDISHFNDPADMTNNHQVQEDGMDPHITKQRTAPPELAKDVQVEAHSSLSKGIFGKPAAHVGCAGSVRLEMPMPCAAAACRTDTDVVNADEDLLDSRCNVCQPCIRINKLIKVSDLIGPQIELMNEPSKNNAELGKNELINPHGVMPNVEVTIIYEFAHSANAESSNVYIQLPYHSAMMLIVRATNAHGKEILAIGFIEGNTSLRDNDFVLEEHEPLLDEMIRVLKNAQDKSRCGNNSTGGRRVSISCDNSPEMSDATSDEEAPTRSTVEKRRLSRMAVKKKLALLHERMREEKEREIARVEEEKRQAILRIMAERNSVVAEMSRYQERFTQMEKQNQRYCANMKEKIKADVIAKIEAKSRLYSEVDGMAAKLDKERDAKRMDPDELSDQDAPSTSSALLPSDGGLLVEAPVFHPTEEDFRDPLRYYEKIWSEAVRFGICKVVPPPGWNPPFRVDDEMRFDVTNQYISRLFNRWGPAARELCAIKLCLAQQKVNFTRPPLLDGIEVNLPKLYHLVQRHGGLETVYNKKRWGKVAEDMKFNKGPNTERKLDQIYVKYLLPYDTLSHQERQDIMRKVEIAWNRKNQKLLDRALNPLNRQKRLLGLMESSDEETEDEDAVAAVNEAEDCIIKGTVMNRAKFRKIATMTYENTFGQGSEAADPPDLAKIEEYYWRLVTLGTEHVCVHTAAIDTGQEGYGFTKNKSDPYGRHPWNPKMVSQNPRNVLQYLGPVIGVTVPTLLLGMLFSTSCWHKDPHIVAWLEYQLRGPERIWYGIPAHQADNFRKAVETLGPTFCQNKSHWLPTDITMIPPNLLREHNVTLSRVTQRDGEYILAFPNAYTCCISTGYTESESVYFAPPSWLESMWTVFKEARESCEPTMFAMEHLLCNIGNDPKADPTILKIAQPLFDKMLREEVTNRQILQERGLPFVQELLSANTSRRKTTGHSSNPRAQDECEYCRASLYLSKVKGLLGRNKAVCLEHALKLLDTDKYKNANVSQLQVLVHVSVKELNTVHDDMKRRLGLA